MNRVIVRFRRPSYCCQIRPSDALNRAMVSLAETDEMQSLVNEATDEGKVLTIDIFQNHEGHPILIHFTKEAL